MASAAHEYYKLICGQSDPFTYLNNLPAAADPVTENEWRDFKEYHAGSREKGCRDAWSEALTAFANTEGGVVVWGLTAKREKGIDRVTESHPLAAPDEWAEDLKSWLLDAANPPVMGVEITTVKDKSGSGFVVCFIPESKFKPHRMEFDAKKPYLIRVGSSCVPPNPALLRSMFYPQPRKDIDLQVSVNLARERFSRQHIYFRLWNAGYSTLREVVLVVERTTQNDCRFTDVGTAAVDANESGTRAVYRLANVLHPRMNTLVGIVETSGHEIGLHFKLFQADCPPVGKNIKFGFHRGYDERFRLLPVPEDMLD